MSLFKKKKEVYGKDWKRSVVEADGEISSAMDKRLEVTEGVSTVYSEEEEKVWAEMTKKRLASEAETKKQVMACIVVFILLCIALAVGLVWYFHTGGGVHEWR